MTEFSQVRRLDRPRKKVAVRAQSGVVLLVVLVMLVVIGFTSVSVMRGALNADLVSNNERMQTLATQGAQIGLRYCESLLRLSDPQRAEKGFNLQPKATGAKAAWETADKWSDATVRVQVPDEWLEPEDNSVDLITPECMAEMSTMGTADVILVTARGFSPDYTANAETKATESGTVIWLQSILRLAPAPAAP
ncbi:hypothetical protein [Eleftheria terrae]|uniref:hypothetical protein n=1 Tax=Eleftheria terrae TaxID=1597781 RepID=UPI00263B323C|nr:hypothetical protein [Eleftheria terrae]WKB52420.1 hypothetical protein N7L95_21900 [Eleftheria terrae]